LDKINRKKQIFTDLASKKDKLHELSNKEISFLVNCCKERYIANFNERKEVLKAIYLQKEVI